MRVYKSQKPKEQGIGVLHPKYSSSQCVLESSGFNERIKRYGGPCRRKFIKKNVISFEEENVFEKIACNDL